MTTSLQPALQRGRYETLDGMRGIAAISVMIFHFAQFHQLRPFNNAPLAVDLFYMLSGFVIAHSYGHRLIRGMSPGEYIAKRFIRLHPTFAMSIVLGAIVLFALQTAGMATASPRAISASAFVNFFYLPFFNDFSIRVMGSPLFSVPKIFPGNPPAWSLFFEIIASLGFLALFRMKRLGLATVLAVSFIAFLACGFVHSHLDHRFGVDWDLGSGPGNFLGGFPRVIYGFTFGMLIYSVSADDHFGPLHSVRTLVARSISHSWLVYAALLLVFLFPEPLRGIYPGLILVTIAPALLYIGSLIPCATPATLKTAQFLGWISYPLYCLHFPIGRAVFLAADRLHLSNSIAILVSILLSFGAAALLTKACDEPIRAWLSRKLEQSLPSRRTDAAVAPTA